uniref:Uncharacterized protein n=1 Tax=Anguilla anguilla TaxID=7936 RepID=A0A0E9VFR0_ANGAN
MPRMYFIFTETANKL